MAVVFKYFAFKRDILIGKIIEVFQETLFRFHGYGDCKRAHLLPNISLMNDKKIFGDKPIKQYKAIWIKYLSQPILVSIERV